MTGVRRHLILVAETYPYAGAAENTFIDPEIPHLVDAFETVIVAPEHTDGEFRGVPTGTILDETLALALRKTKLVLMLRGAFSFEFLRELAAHPWLAFRWFTLGRLLLFTGRALLASAWLERTLAARGLMPEDTVVYAFWLFHSAHGFALAKRRIKALKVVARAHGADLYEARHTPGYIPFRPRSLYLIDGVYPDSDAGLVYLQGKWPELSAHFAAARLGTSTPKRFAAASGDGTLRIVSCSSLTAVKRVGLLAVGIAELARQRPDLQIEWNHFGDGPLRQEIEALARKVLPAQVRWHLHGHVPVKTVMTWYGEHPVDVFVNVSSSEGTPVSIMEAISCGIPVVATGVGGNREIVQSENGIALAENPTAADLAAALARFADDRDGARALREGSLRQWRARYAAEVNFPRFAARLRGDADILPSGCEAKG